MNNIKKLMLENKLSGQEVADRLSCSITDVSNYISENRFPNHERLLAMRSLFCCKIKDVYPDVKRKVTLQLIKE